MSGEKRSLVVPEPHFTLFNAQREGLPEVIVVNDALLTFVHNDIFPWHLRVRLEAKDLRHQWHADTERECRSFSRLATT